MRQPTFNPARLMTARERRARTKSSLARSVDLSPTRFRQVERGDIDPEPMTVQLLATELQFPVDFFYGDDLVAPPEAGAHFRAPAKMSARRKDQVRAVTQLAVSFHDWLKQRFVLPAPAVPEYFSIAPNEAAEAMRRDWGLGIAPIGDIMSLAEAHGVAVFALPADCLATDAFSFSLDGQPYIFLNTRKSAERTRMDVAHELGHLVLHARDRNGNRDHEREATQFASAFLMPAQSVYAHAAQIRTLPQVLEAKQIWRVSAAALTVRMHEVGLISDLTYQDLFVQISRSGYRKNEPQPTYPDLSQILQQVLSMVRRDGLSVASVAHQLSLHPSDLAELLFGLIPPLAVASAGLSAIVAADTNSS